MSNSKKQQLRKKELEELTTRQLIKGPATDIGISGRWNMKKEQLIDAILRAEMSGQKSSAKAQSANDEDKVDVHNSVVVADKVEKQAADAEVEAQKMAQKMRYVETSEIGALVAFNVPSGNKVKSAKIMRKSGKNRKLKVETHYGATYVINYEDVLWVRTGKRWPKWVYNLLKGITGDEKGAC